MSEELFLPAQAVEYLRNVRGIDYSVASLRNLRRRKQAGARRTFNRTTLWTKEELDAIEPTTRTKRVPIITDSDEEGRESVSTVILTTLTRSYHPQSDRELLAMVAGV